MKARVVINRNSGTAGDEAFRAISDCGRGAGWHLEWFEFDGPQGCEAAANAARNDGGLVIAAGGDGTVSAVARVAMETGVRLGIIPLGTFNHFAADLGIPVDVRAAVDVICRGNERVVDAAEVNGRFFVNNSSLGAYPRMVQARRQTKARVWGNKHLAMAAAVWSLIRRWTQLSFRIETEGEILTTRSPFVFVGNNHYDLNFFNLARRPRLNAGELCLVSADCPSLLHLARLVWASIFRRLERQPNFNHRGVREVVIYSHKRDPQVACDGEVRRMTSPLRYRTRPGALRVIAPE